ncbi:hypothetical protein ABZX62_04870 [Streptomyces flavidovirens]|uniref:hypothetical protein n=1 Tax=Streptomyces flavidovirens TaxID=67298 RepID=UPI0033AA9697
MAKALMPATIALLRTPPPKHFEPVEVRRALREYAFNVRWRTDPENPVPADVQTILDWVQRNALPVSAWEKTETIDKVVTALGTLLGGTAAAASSVTRNDRIMSLVMGYAIRHNYLKANPLTKGKGQRAAPKVAQAIDKRCLLNRDLVAKMLDWIGKRLASRPLATHRPGPPCSCQLQLIQPTSKISIRPGRPRTRSSTAARRPRRAAGRHAPATFLVPPRLTR